MHVLVAEDGGWPITDYIRTQTVQTEEEWWPLGPSSERPLRLWRASTRYVARRDEERAASLSGAMRRQWALPPEAATSGSERLSPRPTSTPLPEDAPDGPGRIANPSPAFVQDLPTDPTALESLIRDAPEVRRGQSYIRTLYDLLTYRPTPQRVRATLLKLLAEARDPHMKLRGERTVGGRTGLVVQWEWQGSMEEDVLDRDTGALLWTGVALTREERDRKAPIYDGIPIETPLKARTLLGLAYVPEIGDRV